MSKTTAGIVCTAMFACIVSCQQQTAKENSKPINNMEKTKGDSACRVAIDIITQVGEGPIWDYKFHRLLWIDTQGSLFIYTPSNRMNREIKLNKMIGTVIPYQKDKVIVGLQDGIYALNLDNGSLKFICDPEGRAAGNRYNDGKCDAQGRLWIGSMDKDCTPKKSAFFKVEANGNHTKALDSVTISNGVTWSPDGKKMYYQDSPTAKITAFDFNLDKGEIYNRQEIIAFSEGFGTPDGNTIDEDGMLWVANWGAGCVTRWNPQTGQLLQRIEVPAPNVSAMAFGGEDLDELYITTASLYMPQGTEKQHPMAGKTFVVKPGAKGIRCNYWNNGK